MKTVKGNPNFKIESSILRLTKGKIFYFSKDDALLTEHIPCFFPRSVIAVMPDDCEKVTGRRIIYISKKDYNGLSDGDIVNLSADGTMSVLWEESAGDNVIFTTDFCNSRCIMCPQYHEGTPFSYLKNNLRMINLIQSTEKLESVGITGGEPTYFKDELVAVLNLCQEKFPKVSVSLLTNGKNFTDFDFAKNCAMANSNVTYCIPLYAPYEEKHDFIVGSKGSFQQTIFGIYNLIRLRRPIEIRIVVTKLNYEELPRLADFIFYNMPFVVHVAIMGMEISGLADRNCSTVWIDPIEYISELEQAALKLKRSRLKFSLYNIPLCLLPEKLHEYSRDSISLWKKSYLPECDTCLLRENCCGVFATSTRQSSHIRSFKVLETLTKK